LLATMLAGQAAGLAEPLDENAPAATRGRRARGRAADPATLRSARRTLAVTMGSIVALATAAFAVNELAASRAIATSLLTLRDAAGAAPEQAQLERAAAADDAARAARRLPWDDHGPRIQGTALLQRAVGWPDPGPLLEQAERAAREAVRRVPLRAANHQLLADL